MLLLILSISNPVQRELVMDLYLNYRTKGLTAAFLMVDNHHIAEDVVQEVFYEIIKNPGRLKYVTAKKNWPYVEVMINNQCKNYLRNNKKIQLVDDYSEVEAEARAYLGELDIAELLSVKDRFKMAIDALMDLPDIYKDALLLRYENNLSNREISNFLGVSAEAVRVRIHRALAMLQAQLAVGDE
jgi:RNA polymerase sigma-70 factor (ECF subfamily)